MSHTSAYVIPSALQEHAWDMGRLNHTDHFDICPFAAQKIWMRNT